MGNGRHRESHPGSQAAHRSPAGRGFADWRQGWVMAFVGFMDIFCGYLIGYFLEDSERNLGSWLITWISEMAGS